MLFSKHFPTKRVKHVSGPVRILLLVSLAIIFLLPPFFWPFAFLVLILSMYRHPGPLDEVSKLVTVALVAIFVLSLPI